MSRDSWARSGRRRPAVGKAPLPPESFGASVARARAYWDDLTGGPTVPDADGSRLLYSETAAASIMSTAVALWWDTARGLAPGE